MTDNIPKAKVPEPSLEYKRSTYKYDKGKGHPQSFSFSEADHFIDFPDSGGYPRGFLKKAFQYMGVTDPNKVLHLCSGSMISGITVDIRLQVHPKVVANALELPFKDECFKWVMIDPPYTLEYASNLYRTADNFPAPNDLIRSASRVLEVGGKIGILHFIVPITRKPMRVIKVYGITTGAGYAIRAFTILEKLSDSMWEYRRYI